MFFELLKDRLSFTLVVVISGLATAFITGNGVVAAVVGIGAGLLVNVVLAARSSRDLPDLGDQPPRSRGRPFSFQFTWDINQKPDLTHLAKMLAHRGLNPNSDLASAEGLVLEGGSQLRARLLGGYFVDPKYLPIHVELKIATGNDGDPYTLELDICDAAGLAVRDKELETRYAQAASEISHIVADSLNVVRDSQD
jgi:hypothetical protein